MHTPRFEFVSELQHDSLIGDPSALQNSTSAYRQWVAAAGLCIIWTLLSFGQVIKYLHLWGGVVVCVLFPLLSTIILSKLPAESGPRKRSLLVLVLAASWLLAAVAYVVLYSISQSHVFGPGSDRENALQIACHALLAGEFPYRELTFLQHPITPMPGALLFAGPFYLLHHVGLQNLFWFAVFLVACYRLLGCRWSTAWFVFFFILFNPCIMQDFVTGGDFFTNFIYVMVIFSLVVRALIGDQAPWEIWVWPLLLGVALSSRPIYSLLYPCLLAVATTTCKKGIAFRTIALVLLAEAGVTMPVYLQDPAHFTPFNVGSNAYSLIPAFLHPALLTFVIGLLVVSISFFVQLDFRRLCLILGCSLTVVTLPLFIIDRLVKPELFPLMNLIYLSPGLLLLAMWLLPFATHPSFKADASTSLIRRV